MSPRQLGEILDLLETGECPHEAKPALLKILQGDQPELKLRALEFTAELIDSDVVAEPHVALVEDDDEQTQVRARAAVALGPTLELCDYASWQSSWDPPPISKTFFHNIQRRFERLYRSASTPKLVRRRVLESSVRAPQDWQRGAVRAAWMGEDPQWRQTAVFAMGRLSGFRNELAEALEADDPKILCEAIRSAAGGEIPGAAQRFLALAQSTDCPADCRLAAIEALRFVEDTEAFTVLDDLRYDPDDEVAGAAAWAFDEWNVYHAEHDDPIM